MSLLWPVFLFTVATALLLGFVVGVVVGWLLCSHRPQFWLKLERSFAAIAAVLRPEESLVKSTVSKDGTADSTKTELLNTKSETVKDPKNRPSVAETSATLDSQEAADLASWLEKAFDAFNKELASIDSDLSKSLKAVPGAIYADAVSSETPAARFHKLCESNPFRLTHHWNQQLITSIRAKLAGEETALPAVAQEYVKSAAASRPYAGGLEAEKSYRDQIFHDEDGKPYTWDYLRTRGVICTKCEKLGHTVEHCGVKRKNYLKPMRKHAG
jgi:hypothetical protein